MYSWPGRSLGTRTEAWSGKATSLPQVEQCFLNVGAALAGAGGSFASVAKLTIYVTDWRMDKMHLIGEGRARALARLGVTTRLAPSTLIGVAALYSPDLLVEVEAIAVID